MMANLCFKWKSVVFGVAFQVSKSSLPFGKSNKIQREHIKHAELELTLAGIPNVQPTARQLFKLIYFKSRKLKSYNYYVEFHSRQPKEKRKKNKAAGVYTVYPQSTTSSKSHQTILASIIKSLIPNDKIDDWALG